MCSMDRHLGWRSAAYRRIPSRSQAASARFRSRDSAEWSESTDARGQAGSHQGLAVLGLQDIQDNRVSASFCSDARPDPGVRSEYWRAAVSPSRSRAADRQTVANPLRPPPRIAHELGQDRLVGHLAGAAARGGRRAGRPSGRTRPCSGPLPLPVHLVPSDISEGSSHSNSTTSAWMESD